MIAMMVPIAMPIPRLPREDVFLPVTTKMIVPVTKIVCVPEVVSVSEIVSITEVASAGVSLVPHAGDGWISAIRES
jgi:hypothetical protein